MVFFYHFKVVEIRYRDDGIVFFRHIGEHKFNENGRAILIVHGEDGTVVYRDEGYVENCKYHGQGIRTVYYDNGKIMYKGEFKNDKKNNQGIDYYDNGKIMYEGEFKNDKKEGYGILYFRDGKIIYEGEFKNDKKHGHGILYYQDGNKFYEQASVF